MVKQGNHHIIGKQILDFRLTNGVNGFEWQNKMSDFCRKHLQPAIEALFDRYSDDKKLIRIEKLELDLGNLDVNTSDEMLKKMIINRLEDQLYGLIERNNKTVGGEVVSLISELIPEALFREWLHFLENGTLPLRAKSMEEEKLHDSVLSYLASETTAISQLKKLISQSNKAFRRLVMQHSDTFLTLLLESYTAKKQVNLNLLLKDLLVLQKQTEQKLKPVYIERDEPLRFHFWNTYLYFYILSNTEDNQDERNKVIQKLIFSFTPDEHKRFVLQELEQNRNRYPYLDKLPGKFYDGLQNLIRNNFEAETYNKLDESYPNVNGQISTDITLPDEKENKKGVEKWSDEHIKEKINEDDAQPGQQTLHTDTDKEKGDIEQEIVAKSKLKGSKPDDNGDTQQQRDNVSDNGITVEELSKETGIKVGESLYVQSQQKAVLLIHYLAMGKTGAPEHEMILEKLLCSIPFSSPIDRFIELKETEQNEAENLLKAAIEHWGALGKASPSALREGFLQRDGKLEKVDHGWRLYVEQKSIDVLLGRLPYGWGLGTIKFPWMDEMLYVEWG